MTTTLETHMQKTNELFREDSYLRNCNAIVTAFDERGIQVDNTVFYPHGGGQLGDTGALTDSQGTTVSITNTQKDRDTNEIFHVLEQPASISVGDTVQLALDWQRRYRLMRLHSCLHLVCAIIDAPVNGGSIQEDRARLDFDLQKPIDKVAITDKLNELVQRNAKMSSRWITDAQLDAQPDLVRTMSVKPPRNAEGTIRLVEFAGIDLQACGGTHVAATGEIGSVKVKKIENKGKQNRRIIIVFDE